MITEETRKIENFDTAQSAVIEPSPVCLYDSEKLFDSESYVVNPILNNVSAPLYMDSQGMGKFRDLAANFEGNIQRFFGRVKPVLKEDSNDGKSTSQIDKPLEALLSELEVRGIGISSEYCMGFYPSNIPRLSYACVMLGGDGVKGALKCYVNNYEVQEYIGETKTELRQKVAIGLALRDVLGEYIFETCRDRKTGRMDISLEIDHDKSDPEIIKLYPDKNDPKAPLLSFRVKSHREMIYNALITAKILSSRPNSLVDRIIVPTQTMEQNAKTSVSNIVAA